MNNEYIRKTNFMLNQYQNKINELNNIINNQRNILLKFNQSYEELVKQNENIKKNYKKILIEHKKNVDNFEESKDEYNCMICCDKLKNCVIEPCYHFVGCVDCIDKLEECPICRSQIQTLLPVFGIWLNKLKMLKILKISNTR